MNNSIEYVMKLQDRFSPVLDKLASNYDHKLLQMNQRLEGFNRRFSTLASLGGSVDKLSQSVVGLNRKIQDLDKSSHRIRIDSSEIEQADRKAKGLMSRLKSGFVGGVVGGIAANLGLNGLSSLGSSTLGAALSGESTSFALNELMGGRYAQLFERAVDQYAPEKRDSLLAAGTMLSGAGIGADSMMPILKTLNNIAALTPKANVEDLAYIHSKIKSTGYVQGDEINMFRERGINLNPYLSSVMGVKENQLAKLQEKGLITYDVFEKAMQRFAGMGGKFDGAYERRRDSTTVGRYENIMGRVQTKLRLFGHDTLLPILSHGLEFVDQLFERMEPLNNAFGRLKNGLSTMGGGMKAVLVNLGVFSSGVSTAGNIMNLLTWSVNTAGSVFKMVGGVVGWFANSPLAQITAGLFGLWRVIPLVDAAWIALNKSFLMTPIGAATAAVVGLGAAFYGAYENFEWFRYKVLDGWEGLKVFFGSLGTAMELIATRNWAGLIAFSNGMDVLAADNGRKAILSDKLERLGIGKIDDRRKGRREGEEGSGLIDSPFGSGAAAFGGGSGGSGSLGAAAGLSSTVGNAKSNSVTINIGSLLTNSGDVNLIESELGGDLSRLETMLVDALLRVANSGARTVLA